MASQFVWGTCCQGPRGTQGSPAPALLLVQRKLAKGEDQGPWVLPGTPEAHPFLPAEPSEQHRPPAHSLAASGSLGGSKPVPLKVQLPAPIHGPPPPGGHALRWAQCLSLLLSWTTGGSEGVHTGLGPQQPPPTCPLNTKDPPSTEAAGQTPNRPATHVPASRHPEHTRANLHRRTPNEHRPGAGPSSKLGPMTRCPPRW